MIAAQLLEVLQRLLAAAQTKIGTREIPLRKRAARLRRIVRPAAEFVPVGLPLGGVELVQLRENLRQLRIRGMVLDEILEEIPTCLGFVRLQMRFRGPEKRGDDN